MSQSTAAKPSHSSPFWWAVALIGLSAILIAALLTRPAAIQQDLLDKSRQALASQKLTALQVEADGRDMTLHGAVADARQIDQAVKTVGEIPGVRKVSQTISLNANPPANPTPASKVEPEPAPAPIETPPAIELLPLPAPEITEQAVEAPPLAMTPASLSLQRDGEHLIIEGELADATALSTTLDDLSAAMQIDNRLKQADNITDPGWLNELAPVLTSLPLIGAAMLDIRDGKLNLSGNVDSQETLQTIQQRLAAIDPDVLAVESSLQIVEPAQSAENFLPLEEPDITVEASQGKLLLTGTLSTDKSVERILNALSTHYGTDEIDNQLLVSDKVGEADWLDELLDLLPGLKKLESAKITLKHGALTFSGAAGSKEIADQQTQAAEEVAKHLDAKNEIVILQVEPEDKVMQLQARLAQINLKDILFESNSSDINPTSTGVLDQLAQLLQEFPDFPIIVAGHTDATGDDQWNQYLSQLRANSVRDYLISNGVDKDRVSAIGYGESRPIADNASPEGRALNRRIEINY
ncbi:MAG: OmpA family protein [Gammaproteobacteria bacterium]|nr:OmpA family protein [Gammaproteobacteria bacterium]